MAFGNYYGGVTNEKNILDKLAEMTKELREVKVMLINPEGQAEQIKYQVINEAKAEADKLINEAKAEAEKIRNEAKEEVRKEREQRDKSEDERKKCLDEYLNSRQICYKREVDMDVRQWLENYFAKEKRAAEIHDEMCANTNTVQAKFIAALEDNIEKLETVKSDFYTNIHSWQKSLYPVEYEPIAQNFQELYRLVNVDPLIRMELLAEGTSTNMLKELEKLKKTLSTFLHRFESSLHGLDMYVYYPEAGEMYDALWHLPENEADCTGGHVVTCIVPGVARKAADQVDDDVVLPAVVKVEMSKEE